MKRAYYSDSIDNFCSATTNEILGKLATENEFSLEQAQRDSWQEEIAILKNIINNRRPI